MIISAVKAIEEAIPGQGKGEAKLAAVRAVLERGYSLATDATTTFEAIWPAVFGMVGAVVKLFNGAEVFKKST